MEKLVYVESVKLLPVYFLYVGTFLQASMEKFFSGGVPDWFRKQFEGTFLNAFPGALKLQYYGIALLELSAVVLFLLSAFQMEFLAGASHGLLEAALSLSLLNFFALGFGLRMSGDYQGAANLFMYFGVTFLILSFI